MSEHDPLQCCDWRGKEYDDLVVGDLTVHAFYVKYLLPLYFDVQSMERGT